MKPIKIPSYDVIAPYINRNLFIGWKYKVKIYKNIYMLIQYVNMPIPYLDKRFPLHSLVNTTPEWHFSFCTENESPFVSHVFPFAKGQEELGYQAGIDWALKEGRKISKEFALLAKNMKLAC